MPYGNKKRSYAKSTRRGKGKFTASKKKATSKAIRTGNYNASTINNKVAVSKIAREVYQIRKAVDLIAPRQNYYTSTIETQQQIPLTDYELAFRNITDFSLWEKCFDVNEQWNEPPKMLFKNSRICLNLHLTGSQTVRSPVHFYAFVFSPKLAYKQYASGAVNNVPRPQYWVRRREWFYDAIPGTSNGVFKPFLNPKYFKVLGASEFRLGGDGENHQANGTDALITKMLKFKVNKNYKKHTLYSQLDVDDWKTISENDVKFTDQIYFALFHGGAEDISDGALNVSLVCTARHTVNQQYQRSKNVINNEVDEIEE
jgi:hypothetical protein